MFEDMKHKSERVLQVVKEDLAMIRSGRAQPQMVERIMVEAYPPQKMPLVELASITAPDPHMLVIQPWDTSIIKQVISGLSASEMHLNPTIDGQIIRITLPPLTQERRLDMVKMVKQKLEGGKEMLRDVRNDAKHEVDSQKGKPGVSEDDIFGWHEDLQKIHDDYVIRLEKMAEDKEKELKDF